MSSWVLTPMRWKPSVAENQAAGLLRGSAMKKTGGKADPKLANQILSKKSSRGEFRLCQDNLVQNDLGQNVVLAD